MGVTGKVTVVMSDEPDGEDPALESLKGRSLSMRAVLVPETGIPRIRRCCLSSDTFRSSRLAGKGPGLMDEMLLWFGYVFFTGEDELLLTVLDGPLELQADSCSPGPPFWLWVDGWGW